MTSDQKAAETQYFSHFSTSQRDNKVNACSGLMNIRSKNPIFDVDVRVVLTVKSPPPSRFCIIKLSGHLSRNDADTFKALTRNKWKLFVEMEAIMTNMAELMHIGRSMKTWLLLSYSVC